MLEAMVSIEDLVVPLHSVDPEADDADLAVLRDVVGDARLVCFGESLHFGSELTRLRDRVLRYLVRELGFSVFALESGLPEGLAVDRWLHGAGDDDVDEVARTGVTYAFGQCAEMHAQLRWMRAHDGPLRFWGIDVPGGCANPGPGVAAALARLAPRPGDTELLADADLGDLPPDPHASATPAATGLADRVAALVVRARAAGDDVAERCARGADAVVEFRERGLYRGPGRNLRNEVMADNLRWLLARYPEARILLGAHTMHVARSPSFDGSAPIGTLLADELGDDLVVISTTRGSVAVPDLDRTAGAAGRYVAPPGDPVPAPAGTLDALLDRAGPGPHLLDLRRAPPEPLAEATSIQAAHGIDVAIDPRVAFDAVIHVRGVTPLHGA